MAAFSDPKQLVFEEPAKYHIRVKGHLEKRYIDCLGEMKITVSTREGRPAVTILKGKVRDQCELMGILNSIYEGHLPFLPVGFFK